MSALLLARQRNIGISFLVLAFGKQGKLVSSFQVPRL